MIQTLDFGPLLDVAARSAIGVGNRMRAENQDNFVLIDAAGRAAWLAGGVLQTRRLSNWPPGHVRLAVLDGMGGHGYGREAAESLAAALVSVPACRDIDALSVRLERLHHELQRRFDEFSGPRPGTTLTLLDLPPDGPALLWHAGDSRLYEVKGSARPLTIDHVPATALALEGLIDQEEWCRQVLGAHTPQITQAFILGNTIRDPAGIADDLFAHTPENLPPWLAPFADRRLLVLRPDTTYVLASDGFWSCLDPAEFVSRWPRLLAGGDAAGALEALFGELEKNPPVGLQPDNLTAIVFRPRALRRDETALPTAASAGG